VTHPERIVPDETETGVVARGDLEHGVHVVQRGLDVVEERGELLRLELEDAEQHVHLHRVARLRLLQLASEQHARRHVGHRHEHLARTTIALDAVEVELEVADVALREPHLDFGERVDALDEVFVGALAPEQLDVLERRVERLLGHETEQQVIEAEPVELVAA